MKPNEVHATTLLYIKLGQSGEWENECTKNGTLRLGYYEIPHADCIASNWDRVREHTPGSDKGSITRHLKQVQQFYTEPEDTLWITFFSDRLWWCFSHPEVTRLPDDSKTRNAIGGWSDKDLNGKTLLKGYLSGKLLATQSFQGTICAVRESKYLLHKINGTSEPHVARAQAAFEDLTTAVIPIIKNLHAKDLETLTDLIFRQAGWQRTGVLGEVEKDIDLDLLSPVTQERIAVQVKSTATESQYNTYCEKFRKTTGYTRFYFVTHSPNKSLAKAAHSSTVPGFIFWDAEQLAQQAVRNGLVGWLMDKAS